MNALRTNPDSDVNWVGVALIKRPLLSRSLLRPLRIWPPSARLASTPRLSTAGLRCTTDVMPASKNRRASFRQADAAPDSGAELLQADVVAKGLATAPPLHDAFQRPFDLMEIAASRVNLIASAELARRIGQAKVP